MTTAIDPKTQNHMYELLGPNRIEPVARVALCGYRPDTDPNDLTQFKSLGGHRDPGVEQNYRDCAECWEECRLRWPT
jgi:hypothetical protein